MGKCFRRKKKHKLNYIGLLIRERYGTQHYVLAHTIANFCRIGKISTCVINVKAKSYSHHFHKYFKNMFWKKIWCIFNVLVLDTVRYVQKNLDAKYSAFLYLAKRKHKILD